MEKEREKAKGSGRREGPGRGGGMGGGGGGERGQRERERDHCGLHDRTIGLSGSEFSANGVLFGFTSLSVRYLCFVSGVHQPPCQLSHCRCPACSNWSTLTTLTINLGNGETGRHQHAVGMRGKVIMLEARTDCQTPSDTRQQRVPVQGRQRPSMQREQKAQVHVTSG